MIIYLSSTVVRLKHSRASLGTREYSADPTLGQWCKGIRYTYRLIQKGKTPDRILTQHRMERLEGIGFQRYC